jgi:CubicO group peptidase (beta-lactamase class C family)
LSESIHFPEGANMKCRLSSLKLVLLLVVSLVSLSAQAAELASLPERSAAIRTVIEKSRELIRAKQEEWKIPGVSAAVAVDGRVVWSEGFGWADLEQRIAVSPLTRLRIGSVSKMFAAVAVAALVEQGRLDLDAPIQRYVPYFPEKRWPITARQLAGHMAGIRHYADKDAAFVDLNFDSVVYAGPLSGAPHFASVRDGLAIFEDDPLEFEPGTKSQYSSYGFNLLSTVVEGAAGESYLDAVNRLVTEPLGLLATGADHPYYIIPNRSRFYRQSKSEGTLNAPFIDSSYKWAGGGFLSTPEDLVRFASALLQPGFLRAETLELMFTPQRLADGESIGVGIGWRVDRDEQGRRRFHHGGTIEGGGAIILGLRDEKVAVAIVTNQLPRFGNDEAGRIAAWFAEAP